MGVLGRVPAVAAGWLAAEEPVELDWDDVVSKLHVRLENLFIGSSDGLLVLVGLSIAALIAVLVSAVNRRTPLLAIVLTVAGFSARCWLVSQGYLYQADRVRWVDVLLCVQALFVLGVAANQFWPHLKSEQSFGTVAALFGLPVAAYTALQLVAPPVPADTELASCDGAVSAGAKYIARTGGTGLNIRTGPGTSYPPVARLDAECSVGFDGYCVGEPVADIYINQLADVRWLRLRHTDHYASAAQVTSLRADASLGGGPESGCPEGLEEPSVVVKKRNGSTAELARFKATVENTLTVGLSLRYGTRIDRDQTLQVEQLGGVPKVADENGVVTVDLGVSFIDENIPDADFVELAVVPCLAPIIPAHTGAALMRVNLDTGRVREVRWADAVEPERLSQTACRIDPLLNADEIEEQFDLQRQEQQEAQD